MIQKIPAEEFIVRSKGRVIVDVRSPKEFAHAHIPGAINCFLFDDAERAEIGTLYKQQGREVAMEKGLTYYGKNMQRIIGQLRQHTDDRELFVHCWRGGMRSGVVAWMLDLFGYKVFVLERGYQSFRNFVLKKFSDPFDLIILGGRTGSGKTDVLHELAKTNQVVDLEGIAHHKGSAFGGLGEPQQPTQEMFENILALQLLFFEKDKPIWLEDESQRIGIVNIPTAFVEQMKICPVKYLDVPFDVRLEYLVSCYGKFELDGLQDSTIRLKKRLGNLNTSLVLQFLEQGNFNEAFAILLRYYDKYYDLGLERRVPGMIQKFKAETIDAKRNTELIQQKSVDGI